MTDDTKPVPPSPDAQPAPTGIYYHCPNCNHPQPFGEILRAINKLPVSTPAASIAAPTQPDNDQPGGGAVAPEQAKAEKAGVAPGPPDPTAAPACVHCGNATVADDGTCIACGFPQPTAAPAQGEPQDYDALIARVRERILPTHGGTAPAMSHWNLTSGDSLLHRDAADALTALTAIRTELAAESLEVTAWRTRATKAEIERDALLLRIPNVSKVEAECRTLEDWKLRAMHMEFGWSSCSRCAAQLQGRAESAEAERDALRAELAEDAGGWARAERAEAERDALRAAIREHNDGLQLSCDARAATGGCDAYRIRGKCCVDCPRDFVIDAALDAARGKS